MEVNRKPLKHPIITMISSLIAMTLFYLMPKNNIVEKITLWGITIFIGFGILCVIAFMFNLIKTQTLMLIIDQSGIKICGKKEFLFEWKDIDRLWGHYYMPLGKYAPKIHYLSINLKNEAREKWIDFRGPKWLFAPDKLFRVGDVNIAFNNLTPSLEEALYEINKYYVVNNLLNRCLTTG